MSSVPQIPKQDTLRRIQRIQTFTIAWMTVEAAMSLAAAWMARSPALLAFGGDSAIELFSAIVVLWRFRAHAAQEQSEKHAARIAAVLLFILAAYVTVASVVTLLGHNEPKTTYFGIAILIAAAAIMPWLAKEKRKLSAVTGSAALRADAAESALCAYLALVALVSLGINAIWHLRWADPIAALVIVPLILREGWEAMRGKACGCSKLPTVHVFGCLFDARARILADCRYSLPSANEPVRSLNFVNLQLQFCIRLAFT